MTSRRAALALFLLASCSPEIPEPTGKAKELAVGSTAFAFKLHGELLRRQEGKNVFLSPASVLFALSMAASGARGETADEMLAALELKGWTRQDLDASCGALLRWLEGGEPKVRLDIANSAWLRQGFPFEADYLKGLKRDYGASIQTADFDHPKTLAKMDDWVKDRTGGKIPKAGPDSIPPEARLFLINAVYFKGDWQVKFDKSLTREQPFHLENGKTKPLPFMLRREDLGYAEAAGYEAVRIPYGEKGRLAFYVFLPKEGVTLSQLHGQIAALGPRWNAGFGSQLVELEMPRFKLECAAELGPLLGSMGMKKARSSGQADFTGMSSRGRELFISKVWHKTFVDVNEEGTEAAAATTVEVQIVSVPRAVVFKVDRPFFCAVADATTGTLLFTGSIFDP